MMFLYIKRQQNTFTVITGDSAKTDRPKFSGTESCDGALLGVGRRFERHGR